MNDSDSSQSHLDAFVPLLLLALSLVLIFVFQLTAITQQRAAFENAVNRQGEGVKQSRIVQGNLEKLVRDVLDLAQSGDSEAKAVIQKYGIQSNAPVAPAPAAK